MDQEYTNQGFTLEGLLKMFGGYDNIKHKLRVKTSDSIIHCWNLPKDHNTIKSLLPNVMTRSPIVSDEGFLLVFVQD